MAKSMLAVLFAFPTFVLGATLANYTIDDEFGDEMTGQPVTYIGSWAQGNGCSGCAARPNNSLARKGTWHDGLYVPSHNDPTLGFSFKFNGSAVYVFCIQPRLTLLNVDISLDGVNVSNFNHFNDVSVAEQYTYDVPIFGRSGIALGQHTISVTAVGTSDDVVLFDYALYTPNVTTSDSLPTSPLPPQGLPSGNSTRRTNVRAVVGGVVGGVIGLLLAATVILLCLRRRRRTRDEVGVQEPFVSAPQLSARDMPSIAEKSIVKSDPSTSDNMSDHASTTVSSSTDPPSSLVLLQDQLQFFRSELQRLRARSTSSPTKTPMSIVTSIPQSISRSKPNPTISRDLSTSTTASSMAEELARLRAEVRKLRTAQQATTSATPPVQSPDLGDLQREVRILREEMEDLRVWQQVEPLPEYTPPPPITRRPSPPGAAGLPRPLPDAIGPNRLL
ncbi:hypothetical protein BXZ70DRAFT_929599 [Cristinia sonorae]|uniref:Uncharacterized protein n=1 Tax=Cristinia sonorae TaxID=1940300 RepID=A0A8K0UU92_9AGAR|nr:hypothetical protein BXZ70DRAFT_929599 [Cristinia sonorae]